MRIELTVGKVERVDGPSASKIASLACTVDSQADAAIPASVKVTNTTTGFSRDIPATMIFGSPDARALDSDQHFLVSDKVDCDESDLDERVASDGPGVWSALSPGESASEDFAFIVKDSSHPRFLKAIHRW